MRLIGVVIVDVERMLRYHSIVHLRMTQRNLLGRGNALMNHVAIGTAHASLVRHVLEVLHGWPRGDRLTQTIAPISTLTRITSRFVHTTSVGKRSKTVGVIHVISVAFGDQTCPVGGQLLQILFFGILSPFLVRSFAVRIEAIPHGGHNL